MSNNVSFLSILLAQTENNAVSNTAITDQQDANNGNNTTTVQILPS